ncbi:MAG: DUF7134 domain-containing protein [Mycobacteriales bacterium]
MDRLRGDVPVGAGRARDRSDPVAQARRLRAVMPGLAPSPGSGRLAGGARTASRLREVARCATAAVNARPAMLDIVTTLAVMAMATAPTIQAPAGAQSMVLGVCLSLPLLWRRRHPMAVFAVLTAVAFVQWLAAVRSLGDVALLLVLYTIAASLPRIWSLGAAVVLLTGVLMASIRFAPYGDGVIGSIVFLSGLVVAAFFLGTTVRNRRAYLESVEDRAERLERERDQQVRLAATAERTRIAREMHDIIAHSLSVMITLADGAAASHPGHPEEARAAMAHVSATGRESLAQMRRLLGVLRDDDPALLAPQPGLAQLDRLLHDVRAADLNVRLQTHGAALPLMPGLDTTAYRVVQEGLTNVLKHGSAVREVEVSLRWGVDALLIDVRDDGQASGRTPDAPALSYGKGHGLAGMQERVALFGGNVTAGPVAPHGWRVQVELPVAGNGSPAPVGDHG